MANVPPSSFQNDLCNEVLIAIRRITRAIELHSRALVRRYGLTVPQLFLLNTIFRRGTYSVSELARAVNLSQATVTGILLRLEKRGLVSRERSDRDKRRVIVGVTREGEKILAVTPPPMQETFIASFAGLDPWEQTQILSSLHRVVYLMAARDIEAAPILAAGPIVPAKTAPQA